VILMSGDARGIHISKILDNVDAKTKADVFEISAGITRAANTTPYSAGQIINGNALTDLIDLDFSAIAQANDKIQISSISILDEFGTAAVKLSATVHFFNSDILAGQNLADAQAFAPSYAEIKAKRKATCEDISTIITFGTAAYIVTQSEISRLCELDASAKIYAAIIVNNAYTPGSGKKLTLIVKGYIL
jgi:hypothetical protein